MFCSMVLLSVCHFSKPASFLKTSWCTCRLFLFLLFFACKWRAELRLFLLFNPAHSISFVVLASSGLFQRHLITESSGFLDESVLLFLRLSCRQ